MGGLLVATLLTLVFLPTLYVTLFRGRAGRRRRSRPDRDGGGLDAAMTMRAATRVDAGDAFPPGVRAARGARRRAASSSSTRSTRRRSASATSTRRPRSTSSSGPARSRADRAARPGRAPDPPGAARDDVAMLRQAVREYFARARAATRRQLRQLLRIGRISLVIGLGVLAVAMVSAISSRPGRPLRLRRDPGAQPADRRLGRAVAADRDLPLRLVADPRRGAALRPPERDARAPRQLTASSTADPRWWS